MAICDEGEGPLPDELDTDTGESSESIEEEEVFEALTGIYYAACILFHTKSCM